MTWVESELGFAESRVPQSFVVFANEWENRRVPGSMGYGLERQKDRLGELEIVDDHDQNTHSSKGGLCGAPGGEELKHGANHPPSRREKRSQRYRQIGRASCRERV